MSAATTAESRKANDLFRVLDSQCFSDATHLACVIEWTDGFWRYYSMCATGTDSDWQLNCFTNPLGPYNP